MESLIANDPFLAADSGIDEEQRNKRINEHYMNAAGGVSRKNHIYGLGRFGDSEVSSILVIIKCYIFVHYLC